jgi:hypothetical protein
VQLDCHPERAFFCAVKDLGKPREALRLLRRNNRAFGSFPYQTTTAAGQSARPARAASHMI